jgi:hypothetical protein
MIIDDLIALSMREIQAIADGEIPTASELDLAVKRFNTYIKSLYNDTVFICCQDTGVVTTVSGQKEYPTDPGTYRVRHFSDDRINILSTKGRDQYKFPNDDGRIDAYIDYTQSPPVIEFIIAPDQDGLVYEYRRDMLLDDVALGDDIELTDNALEMLILGLAYKLCSSYGVDKVKREEVLNDYRAELIKYKQAQTVRVGNEIVRPNIVMV